MEKLRSYGYADIRRARNSLAEVRNAYQIGKISLKTGQTKENGEIKLYRDRTAELADQMWRANRKWVNTKFEPRLLFLQQDTTNPIEKRCRENLVEKYYRRGLSTTVTMRIKAARHETFDPQDTIVAYTGSFLRMLKISEMLTISHRRALELAEQSSILDGQTFIRILRKYNERFPERVIAAQAVEHPTDIVEQLEKFSDRCIALSIKPEYYQIPMRVIRVAVTGHYRHKTEAYLDTYIKDKFSANNSENVVQKVIFERSKHKQRKKTFVPNEIRLAGESLQGVRRRYRIDDKTITAITSLAKSDIFAFERGELVDVNPMQILSGVMKYLDIPAGFGNANLKKMYSQIEILNWLRVFTQNGEIPKNKRLGRAIRLLRMAEIKANPQDPLSAEKEIFAPKAHVHPTNLSKWETGSLTPSQISLKNLLDASVLATLDKDNKAMQYLRLQIIETNGYKEGDEDPMTLNQLKECSFGELMRYLRHLKGVRKKDFSKKFGISIREIGMIEKGDRQIKEIELASFIEFLGLETDSSLEKILQNKAFGTGEILPETFERVLTEKYLFQEHIDQLDPYVLSSNDEDILPWLNIMSTVGEKIRFLRLRRNMKQSDVAEDAGIGLITMYRVESGQRNVREDILLRIAEIFEYDDITNPILLSLFDQNEEERAAAQF